MKIKKNNQMQTPYAGINQADYNIEKQRLQVELLHIQQKIVKNNEHLVIVFEGRDAAGKGSTIKRFTENLMPSFYKIVALGVPTLKESKYWFARYQKHLPKPGMITFFDRSWYTRALIEPTMGYCTKEQYRYFMKKVIPWEHTLINNGLTLIKFYLSVNKETQLLRFEERLASPLTYWKFSENDLKARKKWEKFTLYKEQMFSHTSSEKSPWIVINSNSKKTTRLTAMLYLVHLLGRSSFVSLTGERIGRHKNLSGFALDH